MSDWQWIQLNIGLVRRHHPAIVSARKLFAELMPLTLEWRESGHLRCFFFMRKPPDLRLRFFSNTPQQLIAQLKDLTDQLYQQDMIDQCFLSQYQPEYDRFGGEASMASVHAYFDVDTVQWWFLDLLKQQGQQSVLDDVFLIIILQDLFQRTLFVPEEISQTWLTLGNYFEREIQGLELNRSVLSKFSEEIKIQTKEDLIRHNYLEANAQLSQNLQHLWQVPPPKPNLSDTLATIAQFTLHRHGFDAQRVGTLINQVFNQ